MIKSFLLFIIKIYLFTVFQFLLQTHIGPMVTSFAFAPPKCSHPMHTKQTFGGSFGWRRLFMYTIALR